MFEDGSVREYKANYEIPNPIVTLQGRPIGFKVFTGKNSNGTPNMPLQVQVIYNSCMCPLSFFVEKTAPSNMAITVGIDIVAKTQPI